jgi:UDP-N-acetylmuramoyl-L-alanyl-D-glutamate--2,6-diaminopimelate ligase
LNVLQQIERLGARITRLTADSRKVSPGIAFAAYPGERVDGRTYISQALERGSDAVLWERENFTWNSDWHVTNLGVAQLREHVGEIASAVYGDPSEHLWMLGVTGTNGKTSVSHWLAQCLNSNQRSAAIIGTLGNGFLGLLETAINTTPDAIELQEYLATFRERGADSVAMEVSSHGLAQGRVKGVSFDVAVFTNLSRDHLDYHGDMASYGEAKAKLFAMPSLHHAVINLDDAFGLALAARTRDSGLKTIGYSIDGKVAVDFPVLRATGLEFSERGLTFHVRCRWGSAPVFAPVFGRFNAYNVLAVLGGLLASNIGFAAAVKAIAGIQPVPGRMQQLGGGELALLLVDYAHSPDALEKTLIAARELVAVDGKLVCVFGCGGNRDAGKRPMMGAIAERLADSVILTSDNPRDEDPLLVLNDIRRGMLGDCQIVPDRHAAILQSIAQSKSGDVILIAGKGHEDYQEIRGVRFPFSDIAVARRALGDQR